MLTIPGKDFSLESHSSVDMRLSETAVSGPLKAAQRPQACLPPAVESTVAGPHTALVVMVAWSTRQQLCLRTPQTHYTELELLQMLQFRQLSLRTKPLGRAKE